ncbi:MAG: Flp pilus assembly protein CpaB [Acidobacteria bacterium]|nr:Flp pilus assembly protein CpaB [Acidobacteriota bacterium]MBI3473273.1 Flp pilus assembly protein CpaB [Candidatus Solibacter usitatus]
MDRRFLTVLGMSVVLALVVAGLFYQVTSSAAGRKRPSDMRDLVAAAEPLSLGMSIKPNQLKVVKVPMEMFPKNGFSKVEEVIDRPVISNVLADEPILEGRLAPRGSGMGLAPIIPSGMRAVAVRVNEVAGVAGFALPGMRVDVLVTGRPPNGNGSVTTTVLQNITVLSANQQIQPDSRGQAINATVVNLLVTPAQAEILTLAGSEGKVQLILRNAADQKTEPTPGKELNELFGMRGTRQIAQAEPAPRPRPRPAPQAAPAPPPPPAPVVVPDEIIMIRGNQKTVEVIGQKKVQ